MKTLRAFATICLASALLALSAHAADLSGTWKWTSSTKSGPAEITAVLLLKDGALTGTVTGRQGPAEISEASVKDGMVAIKYQGKIDGDAITGTIERPGPNGAAPTKTEWKATRAH